MWQENCSAQQIPSVLQNPWWSFSTVIIPGPCQLHYHNTNLAISYEMNTEIVLNNGGNLHTLGDI